MKRFFRKISPFLICLSIFFIIAGCVYLLPSIFLNNGIYLIVLIAAGFFLVFMYYQIKFITPLEHLNREIALFITGGKRGKVLNAKRGHFYTTFLTQFFNKVIFSLKNIRDEILSGKTLKTEVELAADIQEHVLGKKHFQTESLRIVANSKSATEVWGDSYDIISNEDGNHYLYVWDVTGHGVASGFVMMIANSLISGFSKLLLNSDKILAETNSIMKPRIKGNMMMSLLMIRWDEIHKQMYMCWAGHEYIIHYQAKKKKAYAKKSGGIALGMIKNISKTLKEVSIDFAPGDVLILYTDGITEARNSAAKDILFWVPRIIDAVESAGRKTAQWIFNNITIQLSKFMGYNHEQLDDITLITVEHALSGEDEEPKKIADQFITEWNWNSYVD